MSRVGLWLIGAFGSVGTTVAVGLAALRNGQSSSTGLVTALPAFDDLDLDPPEHFVIGGHEVRRTHFDQSIRDLRQRSGLFPQDLTDNCSALLDDWARNVRPGTILNTGTTIARMADDPALRDETPSAAIKNIQADLQAFRDAHQLDQVVVVNVASTEPPVELNGHAHDLASAPEHGLPASTLYARAAVDLGMPYVNFTPSLGASFPAMVRLAEERGACLAGQDGKTGETLVKSVLAPLFSKRNLRILSWVGHNLIGNSDGRVLNDPRNKQAKLAGKDRVVSEIAGYQPRTHTSIEYIESLDDWKTAWDFIHFEGFLGVKMSLQFTWQGCDSILAAPLIIDLARLSLLAQRRGESGVLRHLACFFKSPMGVDEHDFAKQFAMLEEYATTATARV